MKKVLLVFPSLSIKNDEGAKHRLNSFINSYAEVGYKVTTLAFVKGSYSGASNLNKNSQWILPPQILPISKNRFYTAFLLFYMKTILTIVSWIRRVNIVQMECFAFNNKLCYPKSKYYVDFHGDALYEYVETGRGKIDDWFALFTRKLQIQSIISTQKIICVTIKLKEQLEKNTGIPIENYSIISCGVDLNRFTVPPAKVDFDLSDRIMVGYCGGLQKWQNIDKILSIVLELRQLDHSVFFCLFTNSDIVSIKSKLDEIGKDNYMVKALKSKEVPSYLKLLDAGFLIRDNLILNYVSSPTKISEYLAAGAGLICTKYSGDYEVFSSSCKDVVFVMEGYGKSEIHSLYLWLKNRKGKKQPNDFLRDFSFEEQFQKAALI